ncbi:MAG: VOC family protein [Caulobacterales bacterium]|jgi:3,4-dihydroxy-9,10-secoandrosta-1,3,5(10)-triene-9,17-dione 4,5-dioxygenase
MVRVQQLQYIVLGAKDLDAWDTFATKGIGLVLRERTADTLYLRCDRAFARIIVVKSDNEDAHALGWSVSSEAEFEAFKAKLEGAGIRFEEVSREAAFARKALKVLRLSDPDGIVHEIAWGIAVDDRTPFISPIVEKGFRSGDLGLGHSVLSIRDLDASKAFFRDVLGLKVTSHFFIHGFEAVFLRCNARHHSVAISMSNRAKRLQHLQIEYNDFDDLGRAMDRAEDLPMPLVATLGKHASDFVTSFYVRAPSDVTVELGYGARLLPDDAPTEYEDFTGSIWGHRRGMENA